MAESKKNVDYQAKFNELVEQDIDLQAEAFLKSFIFELGDNWKDVAQLQKDFEKAVKDSGEPRDDLNPIMAADFLQKHGKERTALQRKEEVKDIDLNNDDRIAFIEMSLLVYKPLVLRSYYKRIETECPHDLSKDGVGVCGVGDVLLEELFTMPEGMSAELEAAIEEFTAQKRARNDKIKGLQEKADLGGVKGLAAKNELAQMDQEDLTWMNRVELTLNAAKRKAAKSSGSDALAKKQAAEEAAKKAKLEEGRNKMKARAALWENK